jgi:hypothetical protein
MYHVKTLGNLRAAFLAGDENPVTKLQECISAMVPQGTHGRRAVPVTQHQNGRRERENRP